MKLTQINIKGFRNFKNATINFSQKSLIIGPNDVGKTNLIHALRILLDRSLSDLDLEPKDSDFYAYEEINEFSILLHFTNVTEEIIRSRFKERVSETGDLFLSFKAKRDPKTQSIKHAFFAGFSEEDLEEIESRFYLKVLNLKYISSNRNLSSFIKKEKRILFNESKEQREEKEIEEDNQKIRKIKSNLDSINALIPDVGFIKNSTKVINQELEKLSFRHSSHKVVFDVGTSDPENLFEDVKLISKYKDKRVEIGGDGKNNQIFFALWAAKNEIQENHLLEVTIYCIEEPEVHLHPHQQRKLAEYLSVTLKSQIIITSHSPQIASEFSPNSIVRLFFENFETKIANDGCSNIIGESFKKFGHRMSIIPAEAFFADVIFLVEGTSEILFFKALALNGKEKIDLDRENISILSVEGVGFEVYIQILNALGINWVLRTDNDVSKIPRSKNKFRFAGVQRCLTIYRKFCVHSEAIEKLIKEKESLLSGFDGDIPPKSNRDAAAEFISALQKYDIYISEKDLETDLLSSEIKPLLQKYLETTEDADILIQMQKNKATFMYAFLKEYSIILKELHKNKIALPLKRCKTIAENVEIL